MTDSGSMTNRSQAMVDWLVVKHLAFVDGLRTAMQQAATPAAPVQDDDAEWPIGRNAKLDELIALAAFAAARESGNGYDQATTRRHAARAAKLWQEHIARLTPDRVTPLVEALRYTLDDWEALSRIVKTNVRENDEADRVRWKGVWYDGPLATAYLKTLRAIEEMADRNIAALRAMEADNA